MFSGEMTVTNEPETFTCALPYLSPYSRTLNYRPPVIRFPHNPVRNCWEQACIVQCVSIITFSIIRIPCISAYFGAIHICAVKRGLTVVFVIGCLKTNTSNAKGARLRHNTHSATRATVYHKWIVACRHGEQNF